MKKIDEYPHNGYPTYMGTGTGRIFIQRVGYGGATTRTLPVPLTSLVTGNFYNINFLFLEKHLIEEACCITMPTHVMMI